MRLRKPTREEMIVVDMYDEEEDDEDMRSAETFTNAVVYILMFFIIPFGIYLKVYH